MRLLFLLKLGENDEALVHYHEALDASRSILGNTHPHTLIHLSSIGSVLEAQGDINHK